jgi:thiol-disulfide isomerase/thioredoxin
MTRLRALLPLALLAAACGGPAERMPDARLPSLGGGTGASLAACPTERCLTAVVAPWCGVCHRVTPDVVRLRRHLDSVGVASRVVVGLDELPRLKEFAALYGPDALLDERGAVAARGVPLFLVSDRSGAILKRVEGFPSGASSAAELAGYFGLP